MIAVCMATPPQLPRSGEVRLAAGSVSVYEHDVILLELHELHCGSLAAQRSRHRPDGLSSFLQVAERTAADKKGGHLCRRLSDGRFMLRESAMCPDDDKASFEDISKHKFFNTNNLWVNLPKLKVGPTLRQQQLRKASLQQLCALKPMADPSYPNQSLSLSVCVFSSI